jgi:uncharacterized protein (DUF1919 family)
MGGVFVGIKDVLRPIKRKIVVVNNRRKLKNRDFTIISDNCWGGFVYQRFGLEYKSPFIGLFLTAPDYIKLLSNLHYYMNLNLRFIEKSQYEQHLKNKNLTINYPVALLDDLEIHFMHYESKQEAMEKWKRRTDKIMWDNLFFKMGERELCDKSILKQFDQLQYNNKVSFTAKEYPELRTSVWLKELYNDEEVVNEHVYYKKYFDVVKWLNQDKKFQ